jgi:hypothetical protein
MSMLTHRFEQILASSGGHAPARSVARRAMIKRACSRALAILLLSGLLAGLIALKAAIFLPRF